MSDSEGMEKYAVVKTEKEKQAAAKVVKDANEKPNKEKEKK